MPDRKEPSSHRKQVGAPPKSGEICLVIYLALRWDLALPRHPACLGNLNLRRFCGCSGTRHLGPQLPEPISSFQQKPVTVADSRRQGRRGLSQLPNGSSLATMAKKMGLEGCFHGFSGPVRKKACRHRKGRSRLQSQLFSVYVLYDLGSGVKDSGASLKYLRQNNLNSK